MRYADWLAGHAVDERTRARQGHVARIAARPVPMLVVVDATEGVAIDTLMATLDSLALQSWGHWRAEVVGAGPELVPDHLRADERIRVHPPDGFWNAANRLAGEFDLSGFALFLRAGDRLAYDCLYQIAAAAAEDPLVDLVTFDDDLVGSDGGFHDPRFRPAWSPELLLTADYIGRAFAVRVRRFLFVEGFRGQFGSVARWDLLLRSGVDERRVTRVPRVLAHLVDRPDQVADEAVLAVADALVRDGVPAQPRADGNRVTLDWDLADWPSVSIVIATRHNRPMLSRLLPGIASAEYPQLDVVVVDNGGRTADNEAWYAENAAGLDLTVEWWDAEFNYSAVNNRGAALARGDVLVFLNDDVEALEQGWLHELVGWATRPEVGCVGLQLLDPEERIQFAGTVVGLNGFAEHVFATMNPGEETLLGPNRWYRNVLAITGACLAVRRDRFEAVGGFDERFVLCGSDVTLGLDLRLEGFRNVVSPARRMRHHESATRGTHVPANDFFMSYWRYHPWLMGGDPYFSPNLSLVSRVPTVRSPDDPTVGEMLSGPLGRPIQVFRQQSDPDEAKRYADACRAGRGDIRAVHALHAATAGRFEPRTVNWFIPDIDSPFYGGINTAFRIADHLARNHGVENRFIVWGAGPEGYVRSALAAAFPGLASSPIVIHDGSLRASLEEIPEADVSVATLWVTAYQLVHFPRTKRKFYLIQDFEPVFNPAGTLYALAEESYRLGLYGLCNTDTLRTIYERDYGGTGWDFTPAVEPSIFHAEGRAPYSPDRPTTVFVYARAGHWRNCWEMASLALTEIKRRLGDKVRIVAAGSWARPEGDEMDVVVRHLGLVDYRYTGALYRSADVGLALTVSKHPSYLPLELMACGVPSVAFDSPSFGWLLRDEENSLLVEQTVDGITDGLERLIVDVGLRERLAKQGLVDIAERHASWDRALGGVYDFLSDPDAAARAAAEGRQSR